MTRMATCSIQPSNLDHQNLTESLVALYYTKEGLEDFVMDEITQFQRDTLNAIAIKHNLPKGIKCNSCTTANILPCRTVGYCTTGGRCQVHNVKDPALKSDIPCKNNICKDFREMIRREHRFYLPNKTEPSWKNADATKFCSDPFQILKCFLPLEGYNNKQNIKDIDFNGIINAVINCKVFQNKLSAKLFQKRNVFVEARDIGRNIRHLSNLSVSDTEKAKYINTLIQLLSDRKYLVSNSKALDAVTKLQMLKANGLPPNEETKGIINAVYGYIKSTEAKHIEMTEQAAIELKQKIQKGEKSASKHLENHLKKAVMKIERKSKIELKKLEIVRRKTKLEIQNASKPFRTCIDVKSPPSSINLKTDIPGGTYQQHISERKVMSPYSVDFDYERLKEDFRRDLILYYGDVYNKIADTPLIEEHNVSPLNLYVEPKLQSVDIAKYCNQLENTPLDTYIKSFQDLFFNGPNPCKNIYITSNAASGKTVLLKRFCQLWCKSHSNEQCTKDEQEKVDALRKFDFVFMLPLDKSDTNVCDVDELIEKLIVNKLSRHIHYSKKFLIEVLHRQKCLMMLDGLDKWIHPDNCSLCRTDHIPKRRIRPHCTFITATSLWKFNALSLKDTQIDKHVNICALDENTSTELITKAVDALNDRCIHKMSVEEIKSKISSFKIDRNLRFNPFNILQLTCLLFDGKYIGSTKCELYCSMINLTLARYSDKLRSLKLNSSTLLQCPPCLMHHDECKRNFKFLLCIGELAFTKLFSKGSSAVFDLATVSEYMQKKTLEMCLKLGILTQNKIAVLFSSRHCNFQFHNRSMQMFFAALYACSERGQKILQEGRVSIIRKFQREIDDSEILDFFVFLNGFSQQLLRKILRVSIASKEEADGIQNFRAISSVIRSADEHSKIVKFYQRVVVECSKESMHCSKDEVSFPLEDIIIDSDVKSNENMEVLGLCFGKYAQKLKSVCIRECTSSDEAKSILDWLKVTNISHLEKLELRSIPPGFILKLLLERSRDTLFCLDLCSFEFENASHIYRNKVSKFELEHIREITQMKFLQVITLASLILRHTDMDLLLNFLSSKKEMRQIILYYVECIEQRTNNCNGHSLDVSLHANLHVFGLDRVPVTRIKMNSSNLEECWVGKLSSSILSQVFADLKSSEQLQTLYCLRHDDICAMLESLPKLHQLRYIYFREINFGNRVISLNSKNVRLVTLTDVTISSTALRLLLDSIEILVHEVDVCLENITVDDRQDFDKIKAILVGSPNFTIYFDGQNVRKQRVLKFRRVVTDSKNTSTNTFIVRSENL